jgi:hypothetical protein
VLHGGDDRTEHCGRDSVWGAGSSTRCRWPRRRYRARASPPRSPLKTGPLRGGGRRDGLPLARRHPRSYVSRVRRPSNSQRRPRRTITVIAAIRYTPRISCGPLVGDCVGVVPMRRAASAPMRRATADRPKSERSANRPSVTAEGLRARGDHRRAPGCGRSRGVDRSLRRTARCPGVASMRPRLHKEPRLRKPRFRRACYPHPARQPDGCNTLDPRRTLCFPRQTMKGKRMRKFIAGANSAIRDARNRFGSPRFSV